MRSFVSFIRLALVSFVLVTGAGGAFAAQKVDEAAVQSAIQAAIDATTASASSLSEPDAVAAFRTAIQAAIAKSGARPGVVRAALAKISCPGACSKALSGVKDQVIKLADLETRNENVASIGNSPLTSTSGFTGSSFSTTPTTSTSAGGGGSGYTAE